MKKILQLVLVSAFLFIISGCSCKKDNNDVLENVNDKTLQTKFLEKPQVGRPKAQQPIDNIFIALNVLETASYFESSTSGTIVAKKAIKLATQTMKNRRAITPEATFNETISVSSFVKIAEQVYVSDDKILVRDANKVTSSNVKWENNTHAITKEQYFNTYGYEFDDPSRFIINEESIISDIEIITNGIGRKFTYKFKLDPLIAPYYYKNSVKNLSGSTTTPSFKSIEMIMTFDYKWRITKLETTEVYEITLPALGTVTCTATLTETFTNINKSIDIEETSFFKKYL